RSEMVRPPRRELFRRILADGHCLEEGGVAPRVDDAIVLTMLVEAARLARGGAVPRQAIEHDIDKQAQTLSGADRGDLVHGLLRRSGNAQLRIARLQISDQERIVLL